ncbi:MAG: DNA translocase FtsK 4TM domain-containing protein [Thiomicrospira sp.]
MAFNIFRSKQADFHTDGAMDTPQTKQVATAARRWDWLPKDLLLLSCLALAAFLFIVLFSYSPDDPGFEMARDVERFHNYGGATGAWLSSFLLYLFGVFGFVWPFGLLLAGWVTLKIRTGSEFDYGRFGLSIGGLLILVLAGSALASMYLHPDSWVVSLPYYSGGVLGYELSHVFIQSVDLLATTLLFLLLFAVGFSMLIGQSWLVICEATGRWAWQASVYMFCKAKKHVQHSEQYKQVLARLDLRQKTTDLPNAHTLKPSVTARADLGSRLEEKRAKLFGLFGDASAQAGAPLPEVAAAPQPTPVNTVFQPAQRVSVAQGQTEQASERPSVQPFEQVMMQGEGEQARDQASVQSAAFSSAVDATADDLMRDNVLAPDETAPWEMAPEAAAQHESSNHETRVVQAAQPTMLASYPSEPSLPSLDLLDPAPVYENAYSEDELKALSALLEARLQEFGIVASVEEVLPGPVVTSFELMPAPGVKVSQISNLAKDLARALAVQAVRVVDVIPGKPYVGIEIPNVNRQIVGFKDILSSDAFQNSPSPLTMGLGKDIAGNPVVANLAKMPHLLVAGTTGSGKSVGVNSMIVSMLYKSTPNEVRLIMVDPKMLELSIYEDIPHLLTPVVTDMSDAANALRWCVFEMDRRYQLMAKMGVRNIAGYNEKVQAAIDAGEPIIDPLYQQMATFNMEMSAAPPTLTPLPYIVVVIDEFADMIMVVGKKVEELIARLAQKARASGIHLILATQRPSVNVITGLIKANIPTRISFQVSSKIDSRTILDQMGAEQLLGMGDMLYLPPGTGSPIRVHGAFVSDDEVHRVVDFIKQQGAPQYLEAITRDPEAMAQEAAAGGPEDAEQDLLYDEAVEFVIQSGRVSISSVQRRFKIGYNRAARIVEAMESAGVVSTMQANGNREVLVPRGD